jgi:o-succinylbenzoate synthase
LHFLKAQTADEQLPAPLICGLETALLDAYGRANHLRLAELLAEDTLIGEDGARMPVQTRVPVNAVIGGVTSEAAVSSARAARAAGFTCFKLKLPDASPQMLERIAAIRTVIGPTARLRLDANGGWQRQQARDLLTRCAVYDIEYIEQPLPAHDLEGMASLRLVSPIPLAVDEALTGLASGRRILQACAADILILKPQLAGGPRICRRIIQEARSQGVDCVITSTLETGVGVATALHLAAASPEIEHPCGLATLNLLESDLLQSGLSLHQDTLELPSGPGLGVHPDQAALFYFRDEKTNGDER